MERRWTDYAIYGPIVKVFPLLLVFFSSFIYLFRVRVSLLLPPPPFPSVGRRQRRLLLLPLASSNISFVIRRRDRHGNALFPTRSTSPLL